MNPLRIRFALTLCVLIASIAAACAPSLPPTSTPPSLPPEVSPTVAPTQMPITLVDAAGQTVELKGPPSRVVLVGRAPYMGLHLLYLFPSAWDKLVGLEQKGPTPDDFLPYVDPNWSRKSILAAGPNAEQIAALKPDLVLMKGFLVDGLSKTLAEVKIPSLYLALETPEQFYQDVTNMGKVLGEPQRAEHVVSYYQERLERIKQRTADISEDQKPRVLLLEYTDRGGSLAVKVPARSWMQTIEVQLAGGHPLWLEQATQTDGWTVTNLEQVALWNPDKIFLVITYTMNARTIVARLKEDPLWSKLKAVQNNELYAFPADLYGWDNADPRWILGVNWLATRMYPERFSDIDMNAEIYQLFGLFGMDKAAVDEHIMPVVQMDVH
ncbi:MAG: Fe(3+)-citrate-binding protein YfmC precursor [Chloroflexi bacterium ADurb.Bin180]|nr:MAG: Fe(3+)-citrate-binding protein YfmC precursor [Chloroflexi bacterium ADurb.Bin180]